MFSQASVCPQGEGHAWQRSVCVCVVKGSTRGRGCTWRGGGVSVAGGEVMSGIGDGHCSGRYASYWNAFLFLFQIQQSLQLVDSMTEEQKVSPMIYDNETITDPVRWSFAKMCDEQKYHVCWSPCNQVLDVLL